MVFTLRFSLMALTPPLILAAQIGVTGASTTTTQAILQYTSPVESACSLKVADMDRGIALVSGAQAAGQVTMQTSVPHGLLAGAVVYIENSSVAAWNGWQTVLFAPTPASFTFANATAGTATAGNAGVLVDDLNPALFPGADQDSRPGNVTTRGSRSFVVGLRYAQVASDGNRYSRALQANARHHYTLTCGIQTFDQEFHTQNIPLGDTHNDGPLADRNSPGQYAYPTMQWTKQNQVLIDPVSGLRSVRITSPSGSGSGLQTFVTVPHPPAGWSDANGPLTPGGGAATYTGGACSGGGPACALFLRADNLAVPGGATYASDGNSLDWFQVSTLLSIGNGSCTGDNCKVSYCLTVDGVTCASSIFDSAPLTTTATASYFPAAGTLPSDEMASWQSSGPGTISRVDVSQGGTGTTASAYYGYISYVAATKVLTYNYPCAGCVANSPFNTKWGPGSRITVNGTEYPIASVQSDTQLTLSSGPPSDIANGTYSANNFGLLVWKKTATADTISVGYTTYQYGSSQMPQWTSDAQNTCGPLFTANGKPSYECFSGAELFLIAADGSQITDLGLAFTQYVDDAHPWLTHNCGDDQVPHFDQVNANTWYCMTGLNSAWTGSGFQSAIAKLVYSPGTGAYVANPGGIPPVCNGSNAPCFTQTLMQPNAGDWIGGTNVTGFNPDYSASGFTPTENNYIFEGVSNDGDIVVTVFLHHQNSPVWNFIWNIGNGLPIGTTGGMTLVAAGSSYRTPPLSWCSVHAIEPTYNGWAAYLMHPLTGPGGDLGGGQMTLTSALGDASTLITCPPNPFSYTKNCSNVSAAGAPSPVTGMTPQAVQVGDLISIDSETMQVVQVNSSTSYVVGRFAAVAHSSSTLTMQCGGGFSYWNYRADPFKPKYRMDKHGFRFRQTQALTSTTAAALLPQTPL